MSGKTDHKNFIAYWIRPPGVSHPIDLHCTHTTLRDAWINYLDLETDAQYQDLQTNARLAVKKGARAYALLVRHSGIVDGTGL